MRKHDNAAASRQALLAHLQPAYLLALRICGNEQDASDALQEAYLRAVQTKAAFPPAPELRQWFLRVVANAAKEQSRQNLRRHKREETAAMNTTPATLDLATELEATELREALSRAMQNLDESLRLPVSLHYEQGLSYAEAAAILGTPEGTLRVYASRGIEQLRAQLERWGFAAAQPMIVAGLTQTIAHLSVPAPAVAAAKTIVAKGTLSAGKAATTATMAGATKAAAAVVLASTLVLALQSFSGKPNPVQNAAGDAPVAKPEPQPQPVTLSAHFEKKLNRKIDVVFRRDTLKEAQTQLRQLSGMYFYFPEYLDGQSLITLEAKQITVRQVLETIAAQSGLQLSFVPYETVVLWKRADNAALAALEKRLASADPNERCVALYELGHSGDPRALTPLLRGLIDKNDAVVYWAVTQTRTNEFMYGLADTGDTATACLREFFPVTKLSEDDQLILVLALQSGKGHAVKLLTELARAHKDLMKRLMAIHTLGVIDNAETFSVLCGLLDDPAPAVRTNTASALAMSNNPRAIPVLAERLKRAPANMQSDFVFPLIHVGSAAALAALEPVSQFTDAKLRCEIALVLRTSPEPAAVSMCRALLNDADKTVRMAAALSLADEDPNAVDIFVQEYASFQRQNTRFEMHSVGVDLTSPALMLKLSNSADPDVRRQAVHWLASRGHADGMAAEIAIFKNSKPDKSVRDDQHWRLHALSRLKNAQLEQYLIELSAQPGAQESTLEWLGEQRSARAFEALLPLTKNATTRQGALKGIAATRDPRAADVLIQAFNDSPNDNNLREAVIEALNTMRHEPKAHTALQTWARTGDSRQRGQALWELARREDFATLAELVKSPDAGMREAIAGNLNFFDPRQVNLFLALLNDGDLKVRRSAAAGLRANRRPTNVVRFQEQRDPRLAASASALAKNADNAIRGDAAGALGNTRAAKSVDELLVLSRDPDPKVRDAAARSMGEFTDTRIIERLFELHAEGRGEMHASTIMSLLRIHGNLPKDHAMKAKILEHIKRGPKANQAPEKAPPPPTGDF